MDRVETLVVENDCLVMVKVDIRDVYEAGQHHVLAEALSRLFGNEKLRSIVFDVTY